MKQITVTKPFSYAYQGIQVVHYAPGKHEVSDRCAEVAIAEGWAKPCSSDKKKTVRKRKACK